MDDGVLVGLVFKGKDQRYFFFTTVLLAHAEKKFSLDVSQTKYRRSVGDKVRRANQKLYSHRCSVLIGRDLPRLILIGQAQTFSQSETIRSTSERRYE